MNEPFKPLSEEELVAHPDRAAIRSAFDLGFCACADFVEGYSPKTHTALVDEYHYEEHPFPSGQKREPLAHAFMESDPDDPEFGEEE